MKVISPIALTDATLTSTTIPEPDTGAGEVAWSAGTYNLNDEVIKVATHRRYRCVADPNTTDDPETGVDANPATWVDIGPTNAWAMFDNENGSQSTDNLNLDVEVTPNLLYNGVAGFNVTGATDITVTMTDPTAGVVYSKSVDMIDNSSVTDWYYYYFAEIVSVSRFVLLDLPAYPLATLKLEINGVGDVGIGTFVYGAQSELGVTVLGTSWQALDFSVKERDEFGNYTIVRRRTSDLLDYDCYLPRSKFGFVKNKLKSLTTTPAVWIGDETDVDDGTAVFGYYKDSQINISTPSVIDMTIQIEGLV